MVCEIVSTGASVGLRPISPPSVRVRSPSLFRLFFWSSVARRNEPSSRPGASRRRHTVALSTLHAPAGTENASRYRREKVHQLETEPTTMHRSLASGTLRATRPRARQPAALQAAFQSDAKQRNKLKFDSSEAVDENGVPLANTLHENQEFLAHKKNEVSFACAV